MSDHLHPTPTSPPPKSTTMTSNPDSYAHSRQASSSELEQGEARPSASENTPLLARRPSDADTSPSRWTGLGDTSAATLLRSFQGKSSSSARRWPSVLALLLLCVFVVFIIVFAFLLPGVVQDYAMQSASFEPTSLSIHSFTSDGVRARVQGNFVMDASKVNQKSVRDIGRFGTWIARKVETGQSQVRVSLPEYGNVVLGTADVPRLLVDVRNRHTTALDFLADLHAGDVDGIRRIATDWLDGRLGQLRVLGEASVPLKSGLFSLGRQTITQSLLFASKDIPAIPDYQIHKLNLHEVELPDATKGIQANVSVSTKNPYPVDFVIPPLGFALLVDSCTKSDPLIQIADATTSNLHVEPKRAIDVDASAYVRRLPESFTRSCPGSQQSPMDAFLASYIHGEDTIVYVRGSDSPSLNTPRWITDLISDITVPVPVPGRSMGKLIRNFTLSHVDFTLPNPFAEPDTPEANPQISADIKALIAVPEEMNFNLDVTAISADADVFYQGKKLGRLDLEKWQPANSTRAETKDDEGPMLEIESAIKDAPLDITDDDLFTDLIEAMLFGGKRVILNIKANVNVKLTTALGDVVVRKIPAEGSVPVKRS